MLFQDITILDDRFERRDHMYVGVSDGTIDYIGDTIPQKDYGQVYEGKGKLLMTGFFNVHAHSPMTLLRGYGENMVLQDWLNKRIFPFEAKLDGEAVYWATKLAIAESLQYGIVSTSDMYYFNEEMAKAVLETKTKFNLSCSVTCFDDSDLWQLPVYREGKDVFRRYHNAGDDRLKIDMSLHAEYTSNEKIVRQLADHTRELNAQMHVHVSETKDEVEGCKQRHDGKTPVEYLDALGLFDQPTIAAHCVWLEEDDFDILAERGVTAASCPISNMKISSGFANIPKMLKKGINVGIGTDSVASNNSLNFIEEIKTFAIASKGAYGDPTAISPVEALTCATYNGAVAQGRKDCGKLKEGFRADLIVLDLNKPHMRPVHDLATNVVYSACGSDVVLTMVDGEVLYRDGNFLTLDLEETIAKTEEAVQRILARL